jgi:molecular chaperone GrpE
MVRATLATVEYMANQIEDQNPQEASAVTEDPPATTEQADALDALRREKDALQDRLLRTAAEFENYRKRVDRERREAAEYAGADVLRDMLPIIDDLERALQASAGADAESYRRGVELIHKQMTDLLRKRGVKIIEAVGTQFDPRYHEAVMHEVSADRPEGEVLAEFRRGYILGDRLLRPATVKVAKA